VNGDGPLPGDEFRVFPPERTWRAVRAVFQAPLEAVFRLRVYGSDRVPPTGPAVLASNHIAGIDPILVGAATPRTIRYMAKAELFTYNEALSRFLRHGGVFSVRRGESDVEALRLARRVVRGGHLLGMFAEGTRQATEAIGEVRHGAALVALAEGAPIIPCVIQGSVFLKQQPWHPVTVVYGEPMRYASVRGRAQRDAVRGVTAELQRELERLQRFAQSAIRAGRPLRALPPTRARSR
jgi:1-acyl-sn-glycerol-3-phosphate acyltransferase